MKSPKYMTTDLPLDMSSLAYPILPYNCSRLNLPVITPMDPVIVSCSATILLAAMDK